jgi:hypothetical protein
MSTVASATEPPNCHEVSLVTLNSEAQGEIISYLEVIGKVVLAVAGRTKEALRLVARGRTLGVGGGSVGVVVGVALRRGLVLCRGGHLDDDAFDDGREVTERCREEFVQYG